MSRRKMFFLGLSLILLAATWVYSDLWMQNRTLRQETAALTETNAGLEALLEESGERGDSLEEENRRLANEKARLEEEVESLKVKYMPLYSSAADATVRFVREDTALRFLPGQQEMEIRKIPAGTLVQVIQKTVNMETNETWLYVEVPVFDTPQDNRGYIPVEPTVYFTPDLERRVISPVTVPAGSTLYSAEPGQEGRELETPAQDQKVIIEGRRQGLVLCTAAGGTTFLTAPENILYPVSPLRRAENE